MCALSRFAVNVDVKREEVRDVTNIAKQQILYGRNKIIPKLHLYWLQSSDDNIKIKITSNTLAKLRITSTISCKFPFTNMEKTKNTSH